MVTRDPHYNDVVSDAQVDFDDFITRLSHSSASKGDFPARDYNHHENYSIHGTKREIAYCTHV